jgi:alkanesulfonate monooxygenase SsuD/methylene tetrahydromethanopterin reductase-like flavin-dependent oxidoreductase (luciferase family)
VPHRDSSPQPHGSSPQPYGVDGPPPPARLTTPFAPGSVSIRLYPHDGLSAPEMVSELCAQAGLALGSGFDGVMTSEHHGGFAGYLPNPLQMVAFILDDHPTGWAAASPLLLPLRPAALVAEETAWLAARHPGRVGLGVAAGALALDFEAMGIDRSSAPARFAAQLPRVVAMLSGRDLGPLAGDPALARCADHPVPVLSAAVSPTAARRAASVGAGLLMEGMSDVDRLARLTSAYDGSGGSASKVLIRRVWLGDVRRDLVDRQRQAYDGVTGDPAAFGVDQTVSSTDPVRLAELLSGVARRAGATSLDLRVHLPGMAPESVRRQIRVLGAEVVPRLKSGWDGRGVTTGESTRPTGGSR